MKNNFTTKSPICILKTCKWSKPWIGDAKFSFFKDQTQNLVKVTLTLLKNRESYIVINNISDDDDGEWQQVFKFENICQAIKKYNSLSKYINNLSIIDSNKLNQ